MNYTEFLNSKADYGDVVFTPFMGVGSEVYGALVNDRKAIGVELKPSYYCQAVANVQSAIQNTAKEQEFAL